MAVRKSTTKLEETDLKVSLDDEKLFCVVFGNGSFLLGKNKREQLGYHPIL